jgi:hypothetical protein
MCSQVRGPGTQSAIAYGIHRIWLVPLGASLILGSEGKYYAWLHVD